VSVKVGRTVVPPDRAALTKGHPGAIHCRACDRDTGFVSVTPRNPYRTPGLHQLGHQDRTTFFGQGRVRPSPEALAHNEVTTVRSNRVVVCAHVAADPLGSVPALRNEGRSKPSSVTGW
jgi:hypothetical protein